MLVWAFTAFMLALPLAAQNYILSFGDSKSHRQEWQSPLIQKIHEAGHLQVIWADGGNNGDTILAAADSGSSTYIVTAIANLNNTNVGNNLIGTAAPWSVRSTSQMLVTTIFCNWGANDATIVPFPDEATWEAAYESVLDILHARFPAATMYLSFPWRRSYDAECATLHGRLLHVIAARSAFVVAGDDEAVWLKGADNGAQNTVDGVHYSAPTGANAGASAKFSALGY